MFIFSRFLLVVVTLLSFSALVFAAEIGPTGSEVAQKKAQILKLFEVQPPSQAVDAAIAAVADSRYRPGDPARDEFVSRMQLAVDYDQIEAASMAAMIELYTLPELTVMADYYTSDLGRSAERKGGILRQKIAPKLKEMLDKGVLSVITSPSPAGSVSNAGR